MTSKRIHLGWPDSGHANTASQAPFYVSRSHAPPCIPEREAPAGHVGGRGFRSGLRAGPSWGVATLCWVFSLASTRRERGLPAQRIRVFFARPLRNSWPRSASSVCFRCALPCLEWSPLVSIPGHRRPREGMGLEIALGISLRCSYFGFLFACSVGCLSPSGGGNDMQPIGLAGVEFNPGLLKHP